MHEEGSTESSFSRQRQFIGLDDHIGIGASDYKYFIQSVIFWVILIAAKQGTFWKNKMNSGFYIAELTK